MKPVTPIANRLGQTTNNCIDLSYCILNIYQKPTDYYKLSGKYTFLTYKLSELIFLQKSHFN